jgi:hypothetical protein
LPQVSFDFLASLVVIFEISILIMFRTTSPNYTSGPNYTTRFKGSHIVMSYRIDSMHMQDILSTSLDICTHGYVIIEKLHQK